jgi:hypothetical protein
VLIVLLQCEFAGISQWIHPQNQETFQWKAVQHLVKQHIHIWNLPGCRFSVHMTLPRLSTPSRWTATPAPSIATAVMAPTGSRWIAVMAPTGSYWTTMPTLSTQTAAATPSTSYQPQTSRPSRSATHIIKRGVKWERSPSSEEIVGEIRHRRRHSPSIEIVGEYRCARSPSVEILN